MPKLGEIDSCKECSEEAGKVQLSSDKRTLPRSQVQTMVRNWYLKGCANQRRLSVANTRIVISAARISTSASISRLTSR